MKSAIIYYSFSGNTKKVAGALAEYLKGKGEVVVIELMDTKENGKFFSQCKKAFWHQTTDIQKVDTDLSAFDLICLGTPVWAFGPAPAINTYLDKCFGAENKSIILFTTYGSGAGNNRCLDYMQNILSKKGVQDFKRLSVQQNKVNHKELIISKIEEITRL